MQVKSPTPQRTPPRDQLTDGNHNRDRDQHGGGNNQQANFVFASKRLLVLDISGLLCCKVSSSNKVVLRPHVREFLEACYATYTVAFFSSTTFKNAHLILTQLLTPEQASITLFRWYRDRTHFDPEFDTNRFIKAHDTVKYLSTVIDNPLVNMNRLYNYKNTIICDDSPNKVRFNHPSNIVIVPKFELSPNYTAECHMEDTTLLDLLPRINQAFEALL